MCRSNVEMETVFLNQNFAGSNNAHIEELTISVLLLVMCVLLGLGILYFAWKQYKNSFSKILSFLSVLDARFKSMKFKFCSDGDCPLWALAALHALSSLPAALFRTLLQQVMEEQPDDGIMEILKDTSLSSREECARAAAVIRWVVQQSCACACTGAQLMRDLLVLGVPRTHANALADAVDNYRPEHVAHVQANGFMINKLTDVSVTPGPEGTVDTYTLTMHSDDVFTGEQKKRELLIDKSQAATLLEELKKAYQKMEEIED